MPTPQVTLTPLTILVPQLVGSTLSIDTVTLPYEIQADINTSQVELNIYNTTFVNQSPVTSGSPPVNIFTGTLTVDPTQPQATVQIIGRNYDPTSNWAALTSFALGTRIVDPNGNVQIVIQAGISGASQPTWATTKGASTNDPTSTGVIWSNLGVLAITQIVKFNLIYFATSDALVIAPPSAVKSYKGLNSCRLEWELPTYDGFVGVRVMLSTDSSGVTTPYTQFGDLVNNVTRTANVVVASDTAVQVNGNHTISTITETTETVNYSSVDIPLTAINGQEFFALISTVIQDPNTNAIFESQQNGPVTCGFVNLRLVSPTDFLALQRKEDIASRLIAYITKIYPNLDLTPRSEARDIMIDPFALELANMSVREWFSRVSTSISAISQIDDSDGDGISDPFNTSPFKQQIARAYGLSSQDTQNLVDKQFDILGEQAGLKRGGAVASVGTVTFYTFTKPSTSTTFAQGISVATSPDAQTPSLIFQTRGSATITPQTADSFFNPTQGWWAVDVPVECLTVGSIGNVGAGTIRTFNAGGPQGGWNVTNLNAMGFGVDEQSNANFAAQIADRLVTGVDSGTRNGYLVTARSTPGVINALVVAAGDLYMLRDWDPIRQKHDFGSVDIYVQGTDTSEQNETVAFEYGNSGTFGNNTTYLVLTLVNSNQLKFQINNFAALVGVPYTAVQFQVSRAANSFFFGVQNAQFDNIGGTIVLDPNEFAYQLNGDQVSQVRVPLLINGVPATNRVALAALASAQSNTYTLNLFVREETPLSHVPALQPILSVNSVNGDGQTGVISPQFIRLIHTSNFFLEGLSQDAGDTVAVNTSTSAPTTKNIVASITTPTLIDIAMDVPINSNGIPQDVLSVRSSDLSILYKNGIDYSIVPAGSYHQYALKILQTTSQIISIAISGNIITVKTNNNLVAGTDVTLQNLTTATFLNGTQLTVATVSPTQFTAVYNFSGTYGPTNDSGQAVYNNISDREVLVIGYNKFVLSEQLTFVSQEQQTLNGTLPTTLANNGFVKNTWLPESYSLSSNGTAGNSLTLDGAVLNSDGSLNLQASIQAGSVIDQGTLLGFSTLIAAQVPHDSRYIKVTFNDGVADIVKREGIDFTLSVDPTSGTTTLTRILTGTIPDGGVVKVSYFTTETFDISTEYPSFVQVLTNTINQTKHAAADVLIKAMVSNQVDITLTVELDANADPGTIDPNIRTAIDIAMDNAETKFKQATVIQQVMNVTGVSNVEQPLLKFAKSNGAYDIGVIITEGTTWLPLAQDPSFTGIQVPGDAFITQAAVLPDSTIPSGGGPDNFVGMLFQGQAYRRASSVQDFLQNSGTTPSFYIIGTNDQINTASQIPTYAQKILITEPQVVNPGLRSYIVTYQVFNEGGARDIEMSPTEFLVPGKITINYVSGS